jgi:hypothetical protein
MDKRRAQQRKQVAKKVSNLSPAAGRAEATRVVGGNTNKPAPKPTYMSYTLENTMISNYS